MKAIYAFSGDPITYGHIDIIERAASTYDHVTVAIGVNPAKAKSYLFSAEERLELARWAVAHLGNVDCTIFEGLLAQYAYRNGCQVIIRGIRNATDLEAELTLYHVNHLQFSTIDTVFLPTRPTLSHVSSSVVKALVREGGDVSNYVPVFVKQKLEKEILHQIRIGIAGGTGSGKSHVARRLAEGIDSARHFDLDRISAHILSDTPEVAYRETRRRVARRFGREILEEDGSVNRQKLGQIVFPDNRKLQQLNKIMLKPVLARLYEMCLKPNGDERSGDRPDRDEDIIFLETNLFVLNRLTHLVNHCTLLVTSPEEVKIGRLVKTYGISEDEARAKIRREITDDQRRAYLKGKANSIETSFFLEYENLDDPVPESFIDEVKERIRRIEAI